jgi:hypothetical protein
MNNTTVAVAIIVETEHGRHEFAAEVSVEDRTITGIADTLQAVGAEVMRVYKTTFA